MDLGTGLAVLGSTQLIVKLLGPTAEYFGNEINDFAKKRLENLKDIFSRAIKKSEKRGNIEGAVSPRVLHDILNEGSFCDDDISKEYFSGALASSKSRFKKDNRGIYILSIIKRLSSYQLRSHYIFYSVIKTIYNKEECFFTRNTECKKMGLYIRLDEFLYALDLEKDEDMSVLIHHIMFGLLKEGLIGDEFAYGSVENIKSKYKDAENPGIVFYPSAAGVELFLWAQGKPDINLNKFTNKEHVFNIKDNINIPKDIKKINILKENS